MRSSLLRLFGSHRSGSPRSPSAGARQRRRGPAPAVSWHSRETLSFAFDVQRLEERHALAIDVFQLPFGGAVTSGDSNYAVLVINDGDTTFLKKNATATPTLTFANNSQFLDSVGGTNKAISVPELLSNYGALSTIYATSGYKTPVTPLFPNPPTLSTSVVYSGLDVGSTPDGIIGGTFTARLSVVDADGKSASAVVQAMPVEGIARLKIQRTGGDGALPFENADGSKSSYIDTIDGEVVLRFEKAPLNVVFGAATWGVYEANAGTTPLSFTLSNGQTPSERFIVDLHRFLGSSVSINSPLNASLGSGSEGIFSSFNVGNTVTGGQVYLEATNVYVNANVQTSSIFNAVTDDNIVISRPVAATRHQIELQGSNANPASLVIGTNASLSSSLTAPTTSPSASLSLVAVQADVSFSGIVNASQQTIDLQSPDTDQRPYTFTTISSASGTQTGRLYGNTVGITLGNSGGGEVDLRTDIAELRMTASSTLQTPVLPYAVAIDELNNLTVSAVPASRRSILINAGGTLDLASSVETAGNLTLVGKNTLSLAAPISSSAGSVNLFSDSVTAGSPILAGGTRNTWLASRTSSGNVEVEALVRAGGVVKAPVRAATITNVALSGIPAAGIDGVLVAAGDRVLVKNQLLPAQNGIYVVDAGPWIRATDAASSELLPAGFTVAVAAGTQIGSWVFANPATPTLEQTPLLFVPTSAVQVYEPVSAATTTSVALTGVPAAGIDGVAVGVGDRVLVKNQTSRQQNGLYVVAAGAWQRAGDADKASELVAGSYVFVRDGAVNRGAGFVLRDDAVTVGTTPLNFDAFTVQATRTNLYSPANVLASVVAATTSNIDLGMGGELTIDGVQLAAGQRVLVKNQWNTVENGIWIANTGAWTRDPAAVPRGSVVYVTEGSTAGGTSWAFNDLVDMLGATTTGSQTVSGLSSTAALALGMLVTGPGVPAGTTIAGILGANSIRLSKTATATASTTPLTFMQTTAVNVGTTPLTFLPTGGSVIVTAGQGITSVTNSPTSRLQGSTALMAAGRPQTGTAVTTSAIVANTQLGRLSATAPAGITISSAGELILANVATTTAGGISVDASGTLTALTVNAAGSTGAPGAVSLTTTLGDVVAATVSSSLGDIGLTAIAGDVVVTRVGIAAGNVGTQAGSVTIQANRPVADNIRIDGRVASGGVTGDVVLASNEGGLHFLSNAYVTATDQLRIDTPNREVNVDPAAGITGTRLSLTAPLGAATAPPTTLGTYQNLYINRTDAGDIDYVSAGAIFIEGALTTDGSIAFTAPEVTVSSSIQPTGTAKNISLTATAGNLTIGDTLDASGNIVLSAATGRVSAAGGGTTPLLTAADSLSVTAASAANLATKVSSLSATLTDLNASLLITEADDLTIANVLLTAGGTASFTVGSPTAGGSATVGLIDVGSTGTATITANQNILHDGDATADVVAGTATLQATSGRIDVDTNVDMLSATATQKNQTITIRDVGTGATAGLELRSLATNNANIQVTSIGAITATSVTTSGTVSLTTTDATADILLGSVTATGNVATLTAGRSILEVTPADATADINATTVKLVATSGTIAAHVATSQVSAVANAVGGSVSITDSDGVAVGDGAVGISTTGKATISVGGGLTQTKAITAATLDVTATAGDVMLTNTSNNVGTLKVANGTRAVSYADADALVLDAVTGGAVVLNVGGNLTQTAKLVGTTLGVTGTAGTITLDNANNDVTTFSASNGGLAVTFVDVNALTIGGAGVIGGVVSITAGNGLTVSAPVTAGAAPAGDGDMLLRATTGNIRIAANLTALADRITLKADAGTVTQTAGTITADTLVWYARQTPTLPNAIVSVYGLNLTAAGPLSLVLSPTAAVTIAGASTVDGDVTIDAGSVVITDLVKAGGTGKTVGITARGAGGIGFQAAGRVDTTGNVGLSAASGPIVAANTGSYTSVTSAGTLTTISGDATTLTTDIATLVASTTGGILDITEASGLTLGTISANGGAVLAVNGDLTQTAPVVGTSLAITAGAGTVTLANPLNNVTSLTIVNGTRAVTFVDANALAILSVTGGEVSITAGGQLDVDGAVTAGTGTAGDGNLLLRAKTGNIVLNDTVSALGDRITLQADAGSIQQNAGAIDADTLVWYAQTYFLPVTANVNVYGLNLTSPGNIILTPGTGTLTVAGASTVDGDIILDADTIVITNLVQAGGNGHTVSLTANSPGGITFNSEGRVVNTSPTGVVSLTSLGAVTATNIATVTTVASAAGLSMVTVDTSALKTAVASLDATVANGNLQILEADALQLGSVVAQGVQLEVGGNLTQSPAGSIVAGQLGVLSSAGIVTLGNATNDVDIVAIHNGSRAVTFRDADDLEIAGASGGVVNIAVGDFLIQSLPIIATSFGITGAGSPITLADLGNDVDTLTINNGSGAVGYQDSDGFAVAGILGNSILLGANGEVTQVATGTAPAIVAATLGIRNTGGKTSLLNVNNDVAGVAVDNDVFDLEFRNKDDVIIGGIIANKASLTVGGALSQADVILATTLAITSSAGPVSLTLPNTVGTLSATLTGTGATLGFTNTATLDVNRMVVPGKITLAVGGDLFVGPPVTPTPLLQSGTQIDLTGVTGKTILANGGRIIAPGGVTLQPGESVSIPVTDGASLAAAIGSANASSIPLGFLIPNDTTISLTAALPVVTKPITIAATGVTFVGSGVAFGLQLNGGSNGSLIRGVTFQGFTSAGVSLTGTRNTVIDQVTFVGNRNGLVATGDLTGTSVTNSTFTNNTFGASLTSARNLAFGGIGAGNTISSTSRINSGLVVTGTSSGTRLLGNSISGYGYAIQLSSATGLQFGGFAAGEGNLITASARAGVFASGICTGSQIIKTTFARTPRMTPYDVRGSRNLRIVN